MTQTVGLVPHMNYVEGGQGQAGAELLRPAASCVPAGQGQWRQPLPQHLPRSRR